MLSRVLGNKLDAILNHITILPVVPDGSSQDIRPDVHPDKYLGERGHAHDESRVGLAHDEKDCRSDKEHG